MTTRSNGTTTIVFTASRKLAAGYSVDDEVTLTIYLSQFDRAGTEIGQSSSKTIDGTEQSVLNYATETYQCRTAGIDAVDIDVWEMFIYSTMNREPFTITNRDESDRVMNVKRVPDYSRPKKHPRFAYYQYEFKVRENP